MEYDLVIVGGGPAGLTAGIYGSRAKLKTAIIEKAALGGQASATREIANFPGFLENSGGPELMKAMSDHAQRFGAEIIKDEVTKLELEGERKNLWTKKGSRMTAKAVILAAGSQPRSLNIPGEKKFRGRGVSYCATCDAEFFENEQVVVVGSGDAALEEAVFIAKYASRVTVIVIHDEGHVDCNKVSAEKAFQNPSIEFLWHSVLTEIEGHEDVESVTIKNLKTNSTTRFKTNGVFIYVGGVPQTEFLKKQVAEDEAGYILTNDLMETSLKGVYAAGDVRAKYLRQVITAASDGAIAAVAAERYLAEEADFQAQILNSPKPVLLFFWYPGDEQALKLLSLLEGIASELDDKIRLAKVDMSRKQGIAQKYNVQTAPAVLLLHKGEVCRELPSDPEQAGSPGYRQLLLKYLSVGEEG
ncbi:thioredoxin-disulfide reductase [Desulfosporosinus sp. PR]|nr:thioredoxin-disulfide reductase [Desulfosporosinus sp. PR]MDQ7095173.1 thioredoxin-disulfide reductase [Desulfosporosinus sp. PR]